MEVSEIKQFLSGGVYPCFIQAETCAIVLPINPLIIFEPIRQLNAFGRRTDLQDSLAGEP